jgi:hypothetical protein
MIRATYWLGALLGTVMALSIQGQPDAAFAEVGELCSEVAHVSWQADWDTVTVARAAVDVPGCGDGEPVGIQLIADDGDVPEDGPIMGVVKDERVVFDLTSLEQRVEPVIGVRVFLDLHEEEFVFFEVTFDRRYFNSAGNEQRGLRQVTSLQVPLDVSYVVPGAPSGYEDVDCSEVNTTVDDDVIAQGSGTFTAVAAGRHLVCYRQTPGAQSGAPDDREPAVLSAANTGDGVEVLGESHRAPSPTEAGLLPVTGAALWLVALVGGLMAVGGWRLARSRR